MLSLVGIISGMINGLVVYMWRVIGVVQRRVGVIVIRLI